MLTTNDISLVQSIFADAYFRGYVETTDATPTTVYSYQMTTSEMIQVEVICTAMRATTDGYTARKVCSFFYNSTMTSGSVVNVVADTYFGAGLSTCTFTISATGDTVNVIFTGEASDSIHADFRVYVLRTVNVNLP